MSDTKLGSRTLDILNVALAQSPLVAAALTAIYEERGLTGEYELKVVDAELRPKADS